MAFNIWPNRMNTESYPLQWLFFPCLVALLSTLHVLLSSPPMTTTHIFIDLPLRSVKRRWQLKTFIQSRQANIHTVLMYRSLSMILTPLNTTFRIVASSDCFIFWTVAKRISCHLSYNLFQKQWDFFCSLSYSLGKKKAVNLEQLNMGHFNNISQYNFLKKERKNVNKG